MQEKLKNVFSCSIINFSGHKNLKPLDTYVPCMTNVTKVVWVEPKPNAGTTRVIEPLESDTEAELSEPEEATNDDYVPVPKKSKKIGSSPTASRSGIVSNDKSTNFDPLEGSSTEKKFEKLANNDIGKLQKSEDSQEALSDKSILENTMEGNPWLVENVQAFLFLNCPECTFKVKEANLFQDHAEKNHMLSSVLFGTNIKTDCVYIKTEPNEDITEHPMIETEPNEDVTDHQMIQTEPDEDIMEQHMIKTELNEDITEPRIIDLLENVVVGNKNETVEEPNENIIGQQMIKAEPIEDSTEHQMIEPFNNVKEIKSEPLEETIYPYFDKKASTSQPNRLKRSIGTVETSVTIEIPPSKKKNSYCAALDVGIQDGKSAITLDQTNIQQTIERDSSISEPEEDLCYNKPSMSYAQLIAEAINNAPEKTLVLSDIYKAINTKYPYYKSEGVQLKTKGWQNSIRHTLTLNKNFIKDKAKPFDKRGWYWKLLENHSIPTVENSPSKKKKKYGLIHRPTPDVGIQDCKIAPTSDETNIQQTIERNKAYVGQGVDKNVDVVAETTVKVQFNPKGVDKAVDKAVKVQFNPKGYMCKGVGKTVYKCVDKGVDKTTDNAVDKAVKIQFNPKGYVGKGVDKIVYKCVDKGVDKCADKGVDKGVDKSVVKGVEKGVDKKYYISAQVLDRVVNKKF